MQKLKMLFIDLETAPLLAHVWRPTQDFIPQDAMVHDTFLLSWAAAWEGEDPIGMVLTSKEAQQQDDTKLVKGLAKLLREADIVVAHNANNFDVPMFNTRLLVLGLEPLAKLKTIDTLALARKSFACSHSNLDYLARLLGVTTKLKTTFDLWLRCYHGDKEALGEMFEYNLNDVVVLQQVFDRMLPYIDGLPRMYEATTKNEFACPYCGSANVHKRGMTRTNVSTFHRYQCNDCLRYSRERVAIPDHTPALTVL